MRKIHFSVKPPFNAIAESACGLGDQRNRTDDVNRVTCARCKNKDSFILAMDEAKSAAHKAFMAQEPRRIAEPWSEGHIICRECGSDKFRVDERTCYGHYQNYRCAECGHKESRLTETGMSF